MKMRRVLALVLSVCMLLSLAMNASVAYAVESNDSVMEQNLTASELDGNNYDLDLIRENAASDLALESLDADQAVKVIIVMEGESIIEEDPTAVVSEETEEKVAALEEFQNDVVAEIEENVLNGETLNVSCNYTWLLNGVAAQIPLGTISDIKAVDGVKQVLLQPVYQVCDVDTNTVSDGVMIGREATWGDGYTGKGMKIAIIDTGIDTAHQNFQALPEEKLTDTSATEGTVSAVLSGLHANARYGGLSVDDVYYSSKIAFGFNYCDNTLNITHNDPADIQGDHGTHVAGIAAANKAEGSEVVGVAPDAQLYVMKVFGVNGGAYTEDILAALEDALMLGADVVNMSLGSPAGFTSDGEEIDAIYNRVAQTNTVLAISAGNNWTSGFGNTWETYYGVTNAYGLGTNMAQYPDNAIVGSPGTYANVLSVASVENWKIESNYIDVDGYQMGYESASASDGSVEVPVMTTLTGEYEVVAVPNGGAAEDYAGLDVTGKIALVQRGTISFGEKLAHAANAGAIGCLVYNNTTGVIRMDVSGVLDLLQEGVEVVPCASITMANGEYIMAAQAENPALTISFPTELGSLPSDTAYQMSDFSSWGAAPNLTLEPDITAPGGNIYSTTNNGTYGLMSGTSMAAPNLAGMSALVMQYVRENFGEGTDYRTLVRDLLMSTSVPLSYDGTTPYSPRSQGAGLANAYNAVNTQAYLTVDGCDTAKAELGDDPARSGSYGFTFNVNNFGDSAVYYDLNTVAQTEDVISYGGGLDFMSSTPLALSAAIGESSANMVLTHDVDDNGTTDSHDAYLIYRAAIGQSENWENEAFRYDLNGDDGVAKADVQAYLDELVGKDANVDLEDTVLQVAAGETAQVSVSVSLSDDDRAYLDTYYINGGYVEGYTFLTARNAGGVDLSLPYLGFYGDWNDAPVLDDGYYEDVMNGVSMGNQYPNVLFSNFYGQASYVNPGANAYVEEPFDINHVSVSPDGNGYFDTIDDIYVSLLRNASELTYRYTNVETGEVYYEYTLENVFKTHYSQSNGQIIPFVTSWYVDEMYDWKDPQGNDLTNNTKLLLEVEATGVESFNAVESDTAESWSVPVTVDLESPALLDAKRLTDLETGMTTLELTFRDNLAASVVALLSSDGNDIYAMNAVEDPEPDAEGYRNYTVSYNITGLTGKVMIVLSDYALNESYYGLNLGGAGTAYGDLVAYQYDVMNDGLGSWVSFDGDVSMNETTVYMSEIDFVCAEYVNGYVFAQTEDGKLYGFPYVDMLADNLDLESTYVTTLNNVYQDLAYSYAEGKLYGLYTGVDNWGYPTTEVHSININGEYYDENLWMNVAPYQEDWAVGRGGLYGLAMAIDDDGTIYVLGPNSDYDGNMTETAHLWSVGMEYDEWSGSYMLGYQMTDLGDVGLSMDYLQSMTWDHNTESLLWARFAVDGLNPVCELVEIDPTNTTQVKDEAGEVIGTAVAWEKLGDLSGETCALFAPLSAEAAAKAEHANVPAMDSSVVGTPILRESNVTMNVGGTTTLTYDLDPWYTAHKDVVWTSSDETVATVDENGTVTALNSGSVTITVAAKDDETKFDTCAVEITALDLKIEGVVTAQTAGLGNVLGVSTYEFEMVDGVSSFGTVNAITAPEELNFGLSLSTSTMGRGSIWACEYGNTGMIYEIDPATGVVKDVLEPVDGDMLFGMTYSESQDTFAGIMNFYLFPDLELTHEEQEVMMDSYNEEQDAFLYHRINMLPYLQEAGQGFLTGETGNGASSEVVFCGITTLEDSYTFEDTYKDYLGNWAYDGSSVNYIADQTLVLLDNVGRLWYIDEVVGMTKQSDEWGNAVYESANGSYITGVGGLRNGMFELEIGDENGNMTYNVFNIRKIEETPLTAMFHEGSMPRITYHFSDIEFAGYSAEGAPMFALSLYDYWNNGTTNELYLYVPGVGTGEWVMDYETWESYEIMTPSRFYPLGNVGDHNINASIHSVEVTGGVDPEPNQGAAGESEAANPLTVGLYQG